MSAFDDIEGELFNGIPQEQFDAVHLSETDQFLRLLSYLPETDLETLYSKRLEAIRTFRDEYGPHLKLLASFFDLPNNLIFDELHEDELNLLALMTSLSGEFPLHRFTLAQINSIPLFSRIVNFRLNMLRAFDIDTGPTISTKNEVLLSRIGHWINVSNRRTVIKLLGDVDEFSQAIYDIQHQKYQIIYFENTIDNKEERSFKYRSNPANFESRLQFVNEAGQSDYRHTIKRKDRLSARCSDEFNNLCVNLLQNHLWEWGLYEGKLDTNFGDMSLRSLKEFMEFFDKTYAQDKNSGIKLSDFLIYEKKGFWAINIRFLFGQIFPKLNEVLAENENTTISEQVAGLVDQIEDPKEKESAMGQIAQMIKDDKVAEADNRKSRGKKGFFRAIGSFFKKALKFIKKTVENIIQKIKVLFKLIKNGIKMLTRELKKVFTLIKSGLSFLFGKRKITTKKEGFIESDYDFDFDCVTRMSNPSEELIKTHYAKSEKVISDFEKVSDFLGLVIKIAIKLAKPPFGWLSLGLDLLKSLAASRFSYQKFFFG